MHVRDAEDSHTKRPASAGARRRFWAYSVAAAVAVLGTVVLAVAFLSRSSNEGSTEAATGASGAQTGAIFFEEVHATVVVTPAAVGENTVDVAVASHD
ncbi:MAG: hypothetical protein ACRDLZ_01225 [Gaiellaceae bacterium]